MGGDNAWDHDIEVWINNYIQVNQWDVITHPCLTSAEVRAWISDYIPHKTIDAITYAGLILAFRPANEGWHYFVMTSLIGWVQA